MPRLRQVPRSEATPDVLEMYNRLFGDRDPVAEPGTATGTPGNWWTVFALVPDIFQSAVGQFGIFNSNSAVARTNLVYSLVYGGISPDANLADATGTRLNTIQFEPLATDAALLTDKVSEALLGGPLPAAARTAVINAVNAIALSATPTAQQKTDRARMATYLVAASNHYQIQR